ncbi:MAG TPA: baseplate J/gp47 family protein, partial [Ktedonobacteraceae bacterium]
DISDVPTDVHDVEVEDLGDDGEVMLQPDLSPHARDDQMLKESGVQETPRIYGMPPRSSRIGNIMRPSLEDLGNEDDLLPPSIPIPDQPTRATPSSPARASGASTPSSAARREPQPIMQPSRQERKVSTNPAVQQSKKPVTTKSSRVVTIPPLNSKAGSNSNRNGKWILAIVSVSLGVLLLALLVFLYFGWNATVTVVVDPHSLTTVSRQYVASTNQQNTILYQVLKYPESPTGQGTATSTTQQGDQYATGTVIFTNKSSSPIDIPTGTSLFTSGAVPVEFVTIADVLVQSASSSNTIPSIAPIQAKEKGVSGNVSAGSITLINLSSLAPGILTVTNPSGTMGGGASNVPTVTSSDVNTLTATLLQQEQSKINDWVTNLKIQGYEVGTPVENVVTTPAVGQPAPGGKFTGVLSVKVLAVRKADITKKGIEQFNDAALHMNPPSVPAKDSPKVEVTNSTPSKDGTTLSITVTASGYVKPQRISQQLAGMSVDQAKTFINTQAGIKGVNKTLTSIVVFPPFLGFMPFRADQIHLMVQPGPKIGAPNG